MRRRRLLVLVLPMSMGCPAGEDLNRQRPDTGGDVTEAGPETASDTAVAPDTVDSAEAADVGAETNDADAAEVADVSDAEAGDAPSAYRHTITIDGTNDFLDADERLSTTSTGYDAWVAWDASALYIGYAGSDLGSGASASKWVFVYLDVDPGGSTGASGAEKYLTQAPKMPTGFGADYYFGWKTDNSFSHFKSYGGGSWSTVTPSGVTIAKSGSFVELKIPFSAFSAVPTKLGIVTFMINEASGVESTYAGLYSGSFTDGYDTAKPIGYYLRADLGSALTPKDPSNRKP